MFSCGEGGLLNNSDQAELESPARSTPIAMNATGRPVARSDPALHSDPDVRGDPNVRTKPTRKGRGRTMPLSIRTAMTAATALAALGTPLFATASPVAAATATGTSARSSMVAAGDVSAQARKDVCFTGACGSATVKFTGRFSAVVSMSVNDTACKDGKKPKMRIQAQQYSYANQKPYVWKGPWRKYTKNCSGYQQWLRKPFKGEEPLWGMRVEICNGSRCKTSGWMSNPKG
ncbi:hypothetical protein STRIP9103_07734 [Streptomyces ipomoeae 91-03]|uniref:Uncharacterized protein n=2 Tax=Streptomyces ipomoeae TaxID=103232 RepID=L1KT32_9ACTN|nr:hypothetical protein STRIP9103_07734 [Streptomyces ipomoeae 91-03]